MANHLDASGRIEEMDAAATEARVVLDSSADVQLIPRLQQILIEENQPIGVAVPCLLGSTSDALSGVHLEERSRNCLRQAGLHTWGEVAEKRPSQLSSIRNAGVITINDILKAALRQAARDCARLVPNTGVPESLSRIGTDSRSTSLPDQLPIPAALLSVPAVNGVLAPLALLLEWGRDQADPERLVALIGSRPDATHLPPDVADARTRLDDGIRVLVGHLGSQGVDLDGLVRQLFDSFGPGERLAFEQRVLNDEPPTLDMIGQELGVTGSRVCQLQSKAEEKCIMAVGDDAFALLSWRAHEVRLSLGAVAPIDHPLTASVLDTAMRGSSAPRPRLRALLLHLAGPYRTHDGWLVNEADEQPQHQELEKLVTPDAPLPWEIAAQWMTERGIREEFHEPWTTGAKRLRRADQLLVAWPQNVAGRCVSLLTVLTRPASAEELTERLHSDHSVQTLRNALSADERTMRVSRTDWALKSWGLDEYSGVAQEIGRRIDERGGRARITELAEEIAEQFSVKATSVRAHAAAPAFVIEDEWVRRREPAEPYIKRASMATATGAFRTSEGVSILLGVDQVVLRGGGRPLAPGVARVFGVGPGGRREFTYAGGSVVVTWPTTAHTGPSMGSVRELANTLESGCGDRIRLDFRMTDGVVTANRIESHDLESMDWAVALEQLTGLSELGVRCLPTIAAAIEVSPDEVHAALRRRGDHDVAVLLPGSIASPTTVSTTTRI